MSVVFKRPALMPNRSGTLTSFRMATAPAKDAAVAGISLSCGCMLLAFAIRIITLVIALTDLLGGHPSHIPLDVILILLGW